MAPSLVLSPEKECAWYTGRFSMYSFLYWYTLMCFQSIWMLWWLLSSDRGTCCGQLCHTTESSVAYINLISQARPSIYRSDSHHRVALFGKAMIAYWSLAYSRDINSGPYTVQIGSQQLIATHLASRRAYELIWILASIHIKSKIWHHVLNTESIIWDPHILED